MEINNFYTVTVYNKGAEVVRMIHTLIGAENFRRGMDLYFERHDGQAVTCDDFVAAMADASGRDLSQFKRWYSQAGTPVVHLDESWTEAGKLSLTLRQRTPETPGQQEKLPFHIPLLIGLLDSEGNDMAETIDTVYEKRGDSLLLELTEDEQMYEFSGLGCRPTVSLLRSFSAPVKIKDERSFEATTLLMTSDSDLFNRWDASFSLSRSIITDLVEQGGAEDDMVVDPAYIEAARSLLTVDTGDDALAALALQLPEEAYLALSLENVDPDRLHRVRTFVKQELASELEDEFLRVYELKKDGSEYSISPEAIGARSLKNTCLDYLLSARQVGKELMALAEYQYYQATNMTDQIAVLSVIAHLDAALRDELFGHFEKKWREQPLVMDKWFSMQALSSAEDTFDRVKQLLDHPSFSIKNPNKVRALVSI
jgi:aminopeptidase N